MKRKGRVDVNTTQLAARISGLAVIFAATLFLSAGTMAWLAGWIFLALFFAFVIDLSIWLLRFDPALLAERMSGIGKSDQKTWDKVIVAMFVLATPLLLGSLYGVLGGIPLVGLVAWRAVLEERVLRHELAGYADYMTRVRYRFVPHVW